MFLAHVTVAAGHDGTPLTYYRGRFGRLESVREEEAYQAVRGCVLARRCPLDRPLEPAEVAEELGIEPTHVAYALVRLAGDNVVSRNADSRYIPTPLTVELADQMFRRRCVIELGVADATVGHIADADLTVLAGYAQRLAEIVAEDTSSLTEFLEASNGYHRHFVGLGGQPAAHRHLRPAGDLGAVAAGRRRARLATQVRHRPPRRR